MRRPYHRAIRKELTTMLPSQADTREGASSRILSAMSFTDLRMSTVFTNTASGLKVDYREGVFQLFYDLRLPSFRHIL